MSDLCFEAAASQEYADFLYGGFSPAASVCDAILNNRQRVFYLPLSQAKTQGILAYGYTSVPKLYGLMDDAALEQSGITQLKNQLSLPLQGKNILIGLIDTGIDYRNINFWDDRGKIRINRIWDQTIEGQPPGSGPFYFGSEYTNAMLQTKEAGTTDELGHGTKMALLAAGNGATSEGLGAASKAELAIVKLRPAKQYLKDFFLAKGQAPLYAEDDILLGASYLARIAEEEKKPLVLILGLGTTQSDHDRGGELGFYLNQLGSNDGVVISCAAGNEGGRQLHSYKELREDNTELELRILPNQTTMDLSFQIWARDLGEFTLKITAPNGEQTFELPMVYGRENTLRFALLPSRVGVYYELVQATTVRQMALLRFHQAVEGIWRISIIKQSRNLEVDAWLMPEEYMNGSASFLNPDPNTTITDPGNQIGVITTGAYDLISDSVWLRSGRGNTSDGNIKPDLVTPGVGLRLPKNVLIPGEENIQTVTGSSYAAAILGGACALLLEWGLSYGYFPNMNTAQAKNLLVRSARVRRNLELPDPAWGYGALDAYQALIEAGLRGDIRPIL